MNITWQLLIRTWAELSFSPLKQQPIFLTQKSDVWEGDRLLRWLNSECKVWRKKTKFCRKLQNPSDPISCRRRGYSASCSAKHSGTVVALHFKLQPKTWSERKWISICWAPFCTKDLYLYKDLHDQLWQFACVAQIESENGGREVEGAVGMGERL